MRTRSRLAAAAAAALLAFSSPVLVAQGRANGGATATPGTAKRFQQQTQRVSGQGQTGQSSQQSPQAPSQPAGGTATQGVLGGVGAGRGRQAGPAKPAPRGPSGRVLLMGATPGEKGVWLPTIGITAPIFAKSEDMPWQPWSKAIFEDRQKHELEPHARCKASGMSRQFETPYGVEFLEMAEEQRLYIFDIGGPHTFRVVYMDGRSHPADLQPSYYGHSVGWWEGDTLVIDTVGYNERFWMDRRGVPHTDQLHTIERFTRVDQAAIRYEYTVDDRGAYTAPWSGTFNLRWEPGTELFEYVCQQANYASELMVGTFSEVDRTSPIVP